MFGSGTNATTPKRSFGDLSKEKCTNYDKCGKQAVQRVDGEPVCDSCNVHFGKQDSGRPYMVVTSRP